MFPSPKIIESIPRQFRWTEMFVFLLLTGLSIYSGQVSIFYVVYLFWWNELINVVIDFIYTRFMRKAKRGEVVSSLGGLFQLFIYLVFIVVIFAFIANWENQQLLVVNMKVLVFKNLYFNLNLLYMALMRIYMLVNKQIEPMVSSFFTPNMIVLHISIIVGAMLMFFVVRKYPDTFTPDNHWGSVLIILPFLLLRFFVQLWQMRDHKKEMH